MTDTAANTSRAQLSALIQRLGGGDKSALEPIYRATSRKLFGICLRILDDRKEAEDALQDVYIKLLARADRFDAGRASPISWLAVMARNAAVDRLRVGKVRGGAVSEGAALPLPDSAPLADAAMEGRESRARILHCITTLDEGSARAIRRSFFGGETYKALAERDDVPLGTIKSRIRRALARLKSCLEAAE
ncbi:sigma-70 family RNA polymerase sigma factor [Paraurantiacibacter namhicola]|uniref:ECF RNA polymerase sigma factor SigK n=1 Tax=Paraurantiacibacter namhicola TaxID=645517 RepID=A0A1C7DBJ6_9SPHN|nr:sigma-70 family RNA polymerase sigma factor [Paraurantiacibacter namhicola]ANU08653.1 ECF RNA polymerase sigma factor SigK [Paraurantiacibacter namhicola]